MQKFDAVVLRRRLLFFCFLRVFKSAAWPRSSYIFFLLFLWFWCSIYRENHWLLWREKVGSYTTSPTICSLLAVSTFKFSKPIRIWTKRAQILCARSLTSLFSNKTGLGPFGFVYEKLWSSQCSLVGQSADWHRINFVCSIDWAIMTQLIWNFEGYCPIELAFEQSLWFFNWMYVTQVMVDLVHMYQFWQN